jgi:hypothetical protein
LTLRLGDILVFLTVIIIIGFVTGSNPNGRAMIENAQISETASQLKAIEHAVNSFYNAYQTFPGDLVEPSKLIPECETLKCPAGNGNSIMDEPDGFWLQLHASKLLSDVITSENALGGYIMPFYHEDKKALPLVNKGSNLSGGHYLVLLKNNKMDTQAFFLTAQHAGQIDRKLDDGVADTGTVIAATTEQCTKLNEDGRTIYNEEYRKPCAFLYFKMNSPSPNDKNELKGSAH